MTQPIVVHVTQDLASRFRSAGLSVAVHDNAITVWCPRCTERQDYRRTTDGWQGVAFLHDDGCPHFAGQIQGEGQS